MELASIVKKLMDTKAKKQARISFLKHLNAELEKSYNPSNVTYGEFDKDKHVFELQIMIPNSHDNILSLKKDALASGFASSQYVQDLSLFITKAFRHNKLWVTCKKSILDNYKIDITHSRVHLDDPRKFNPRDQYGLNFWIQFKVAPKVTVRPKK